MKHLIVVLLISVWLGSSSCLYIGAFIMSREERVVVETKKIDKYKLTLVRKRGWSGPWYYGYEVRKKYLDVYGFKKYYWCNRDSVKNCVVKVKGDKLIFDKCNGKLIMDNSIFRNKN